MLEWVYILRCMEYGLDGKLSFVGYLLEGRFGGGVKLTRNQKYAYRMDFKESSRMIMVLARLGYKAVRVRVRGR